MLRFLIGKIIGKKKEEEPSKSDDVKNKFGEFSDFLSDKFNEAIEELKSVKEKSQDLEATNFNLGRLHLQKGDLKEATFRFFIMTKFYPYNLDAKYELAYCYALRHKYKKSQIILEDLLKKNPEYDKRAKELLESIKKLQQN